MSVKRIANGTWQGYAYLNGKKRYVGVYSTREEAETAVEAAVTLHRGDLLEGWRRCPGCRRPFQPLDEWQKRCSFRCEENVKKRKRRREQRIENDHWVYTCLDVNMRVLYVGVTSTGLRRHKEHGREMTWWKRIHIMRIEHFDTRDEALAAEAAAIELHQPPHNTLGILEEAS